MANFDRETIATQEQLNDAKQKESMLVDKQLELESRLLRLQKERQTIETDDYVGYSAKEYRRLIAANEKEQRAVRLQMRANDAAILTAGKEVDALQLDVTSR
jgi:hypothetical protein